MTDMGRDKDSERAAQIAREFALMNKVDRMRLKFASLVRAPCHVSCAVCEVLWMGCGLSCYGCGFTVDMSSCMN